MKLFATCWKGMAIASGTSKGFEALASRPTSCGPI